MFILTSIDSKKIPVNQEVKMRAKEIERFKFSSIDALHIASAEFSGAEIMLTTDDKIIKKFKKYFKIKVENPLKWITEVL